MRKRILNLHWGFSLGGISKYVENIHTMNEHAAVDMLHVCIARGDKHVDEDALRRIGARIIWVRNTLDPSWVWKLGPVIRELDPDYLMVHAFNGYAVAWVARKLLGFRTPILASYHGGYNPPTRAKRLVAPAYNGMADHVLHHHAYAILTVAEYCAGELVSRGIDRSRITVVHNGIPDLGVAEGVRDGIRGEWGMDSTSEVILAASQLVPYKGVQYLVDAFSMIGGDRPRARLVILGMGPYEGELREQVTRLGLNDRVHFGGMRNDIASCMKAADVFVLPSLFEYHSIALLEAMRAGIAIISTDVGGNTESVRHRQEAVVVPPADARAIADALEPVLSDHVLRDHLAAAARRRYLAEFTHEHMIANTVRWLTGATA